MINDKSPEGGDNNNIRADKNLVEDTFSASSYA